MYTLFLDDLRFPLSNQENTKICRTVDEAIECVKQNGLPQQISFDHDLGENQPVAMKFMWWLIDQHLDEVIDLNKIEAIYIHSANPVGVKNLKGLWDGFSESQLNAGVMAVVSTRLD